MEIVLPTSLEKALVKTEADADATLKAATAAVRSLKKFRIAAQTGNLPELRKTIEAAEQAITALFWRGISRHIKRSRTHEPLLVSK